MKIGIVVPGFSAHEQDWCIPALLKLVRELARGNELHVFALRYPHQRSVYTVYGAAVHALGGGQARDLARLPLLARALGSIYAEHRRKRFDMLHALWADEPGWVAVTAGRFLRVASVITLLGGELVGFADIGYGSQLSAVNRRMVRWSLRGGKAVTVGSSTLHRLAKPYVEPGRLHRIPIGVDTALFQPNGKGPLELEGRFKLLHVASLVPVKDQKTLLRAFALIKEKLRGARLHIVGSGPLEGELRRLGESLGISNDITFHAHVLHDRLPGFYRAADLCVLASRHEGQEWVTQEAAACGRSTVGTRVGVVPDLEPATRAVAVGDAVALAEAVVDLARRPDLLREKGRAAREVVEHSYTLSLTTRNLNACYRELAGTPRASEAPARS